MDLPLGQPLHGQRHTSNPTACGTPTAGACSGQSSPDQQFGPRELLGEVRSDLCRLAAAISPSPPPSRQESRQRHRAARILCPHPLPASSACSLCPHPLPASSARILCPHPLPASSACILCPHPLPASSAHILSLHPLPASSARILCLHPLPASSARILCPHPLPASSSRILFPHPLPSSSALILCPHPLPASSARTGSRGCAAGASLEKPSEPEPGPGRALAPRQRGRWRLPGFWLARAAEPGRRCRSSLRFNGAAAASR